MIAQDVLRAFRDPDTRTVVEWAERDLRRGDGGRFSVAPVPYVAEILDAYSDPMVEEITVVKTAQSGFTESVILPILGYHVIHSPRDLLLPLPTIEETEKWASKKLDPFLEANPEIEARLKEGGRTTMLERSWPGGSLTLAGSNSARAFRMVTVGTVVGDDVDGWARTAGKGDLSEGDQTVLARRRTDRIADRKLLWISTPTRNDARIWSLYLQMERRGEWHVPCPHCSEMQVLTLRGNLRWEKRPAGEGPPEPDEIIRGETVHRPGTAYVECVNGCRIEESSKRDMARRGAYLADDGEPVRSGGAKRVGYHFHGGLTVLLAGGEWSRLAEEFLILSGGEGLSGSERRSRREKLRSFINTALGETWEQPGGRPAWEPLIGRRESWRMGEAPQGVQMLTAGCDFQDDRAVVELVGWNWNRESWIVDYILIPGASAVFNPTVRARLWELLSEKWIREDGRELTITRLAVDAGHWQGAVLEMATEGPPGRFWPIKGASRADAPPQGTPSRNQKWPYVTVINVHEAKHVLYAGLRMDPPEDGEPFPEGYVHLPRDLPDQVMQELRAEEFDRSPDARGFPRDKWINAQSRPNEALDCWVYAFRAAERYLPRLSNDGEVGPVAPKRPRPGRGGGWLGSTSGWLDR